MELNARVAEIIQREELLRPEQKVIAAVSGGADSLCLALLLRELNYPVHIAHLDHGLQPESGSQASYVGQLAQRWGVPFTMERVDPGSTPVHSQEAWAREVRYAFLVRVAKENRCRVIATGHSADDQVETILMSLLRGAGPQGLAGMPYRGPVPIDLPADLPSDRLLVRPLLDVWREETQEYCRVAGLEPRQDRSNLDLAFTRNRLRHQLIPALADFNPAVKETLLKTGWLMRSVTAWLEEEANERWDQVMQDLGTNGVVIDRDAFRSLPSILATTLLRKAHRSLVGREAELGFEQTNMAYDLICEQENIIKMMLPGGIHLEASGTQALLSRDPVKLADHHAPQINQLTPLVSEGDTDLDEGWKIRAEQVALTADQRRAIMQGRRPYDSEDLEVLNSEYLRQPLILRPVRPGDSFQPLGMQGSMKISDFFINEGIPKGQRSTWPVLTMGEEVLWVVGLRLDHKARIKEGSTSGLRLELIPPD